MSTHPATFLCDWHALCISQAEQMLPKNGVIAERPKSKEGANDVSQWTFPT
jgi:hypothetical protein